MAARKQSHDVIEVDGITVQLDRSFMESWDGVIAAAEIQRLAADKEASDGARMGAVLDYYEQAVSNLGDVVAALGGGSVPANAVIDTLGKAMQKATEKN